MMEEAVVTDDSYDSLDEHMDRPKERWAPLGAAISSPPPSCSEHYGWVSLIWLPREKGFS